MRLLTWDHEAWNDYLHWQKINPKTVKRINALIKDIQRDPFEGIGKPEILRSNWGGYYSRRIDDEHRMVYKVQEGTLTIVQCRYHY